MYYIYYNGSFYYSTEDTHYKHGYPQTKECYTTKEEAQTAVRQLEFDLIKSKVRRIPNASSFIINGDIVEVFFGGIHTIKLSRLDLLDRSYKCDIIKG